MAIYKRGNVWWMSFQLDSRHIQKSTKCKNKRDAEAVERAFRTQLAKGEVGLGHRPEPPPFDQAMQEYLTWAETEHQSKPNTLRSYKSVSKPLLSFFKAKRLDHIEPSEVERYKQFRSSEKCCPRSKSRRRTRPPSKPSQLKPATVNRELALLKILFNYFIRQDVISRNPVSRVKLLREDNRHLRVITREEEQLYLMAASQPLQDFATVMIDTGMRPEEIGRLERRNVFLSRGYLFVPFGKTKTARRKIPLTQRVQEILERRIRRETESDYLFNNEETGRPITTLKTAHAGALRRSKVNAFRLYDLRHTFATRFIESGGDLVTLQALLGHSNIQMVTRYAHPTEKHQFEAIKTMERYQTERLTLAN
jgi:integrase